MVFGVVSSLSFFSIFSSLLIFSGFFISSFFGFFLSSFFINVGFIFCFFNESFISETSLNNFRTNNNSSNVRRANMFPNTNVPINSKKFVVIYENDANVIAIATIRYKTLNIGYIIVVLKFIKSYIFFL